MGLFSNSSDPAIVAQLSRIERKLDLIIQFLELGGTDVEMIDVRELLAAGDKIAAIKRYRELTGVGLAEAKDAVERGV